jgi:hypothetical protein
MATKTLFFGAELIHKSLYGGAFMPTPQKILIAPDFSIRGKKLLE